MIVCQITLGSKKIFFSVTYRRHHHSPDQLKVFADNYKKMCENISKENPFCVLHLGDLNAHSSQFWIGDIDNDAGKILCDIVVDIGLQQMVHEPTHIVNNTKSCIDLVLTDQPNLVNECDIRPSLHSTCHHQINHVVLNMKNPTPPPFSRKIWHYDRARVESIKAAIQQYDWKDVFLRIDDPNIQADFFTEVLRNILKNFIPNEMRKINPRDPPWITKHITHFYRRYKKAYKSFVKNGCPPSLNEKINDLRDNYSKLVEDAQEKYLVGQGLKLADKNCHISTYWSIIKTFLNKIKIPSIPPILQNNIYITEFQAKACIFNKYFAEQCTILDTGSSLPNLCLLTNNFLNDVTFTKQDIGDLLLALNIKKAHGWDDVSIRMIKICGDSIIDPLQIIYTNCIRKGIFPNLWKRANVVPVFKKNKKQLIVNYRPISLLPIFGKIFEKLIYNNLYAFLMSNNLISAKQSGFMKGDSTINQLLSVTHMIHEAFDCNIPKEVRSVYLDISKAFDKVWHQGLIHKLKQNGIQGKLLDILVDFLGDRFQRTVLNGKVSAWSPLEAGVPQGSVLGPLLFLVYINDLIDGMQSDARIFADDTSLFVIVDNPQTAHDILAHDLSLVEKWAFQWRMSFNPDPNKPPVEIIFSTKLKSTYHPSLFLNGVMVKMVDEHKHLGLILDRKLSFHSHINQTIVKAKSGISVIKFMSSYAPRCALEQIYMSYVRSLIEYGDVIFHEPPKDSNPLSSNISEKMYELGKIQYIAALAVSGHGRVHHESNFTKSWVGNRYLNEDGSVECLSFTRL